MKRLTDIQYHTHKTCKLDIYLPEQNNFQTVIFFHGGGLESGDKGDVQEYAKELTEAGIALVSPNYRMFPEVKFPVFIEDAAKAVQWVYNNIQGYKGKQNQIYVGGHSAGGYLSMMLHFDSTYLQKVNMSPLDIAGFIHASGQPTTHFNVLKSRGISPQRVIVDEAAPLFHIDEKTPERPMQLLVTDNDIPNRLEQTVLLNSTLKAFNYPNDLIDFRIIQNHDHGSYLAKQKNRCPITDMIIEFISKKYSLPTDSIR